MNAVSSFSVIVGDLNVVCVASPPHEADPKPVIYPDAVLTPSIPLECFEPVAGNGGELTQLGRRVEHLEFPQRRALDALEAGHAVAAEERFCVPASERPYHIARRIIRRVIYQASPDTAMDGEVGGTP